MDRVALSEGVDRSSILLWDTTGPKFSGEFRAFLYAFVGKNDLTYIPNCVTIVLKMGGRNTIGQH